MQLKWTFQIIRVNALPPSCCSEDFWTPFSFSIFALAGSRHDYKESLKVWNIILGVQSLETDCQSVLELCISQLLTSISLYVKWHKNNVPKSEM